MTRSCCIAILIKSWNGLELVSNLQNSARNMFEIFVMQHTSIWPIVILIGLRINKHKSNLHYVAMLMMTSQNLRSADFKKTQKSQHLESETFFLQMKYLLHIKHCFMTRNSFVAEVTFKELLFIIFMWSSAS